MVIPVVVEMMVASVIERTAKAVVESHGVVCIVPPSKAPDAMTDRGDVASSTLHSSLADPSKRTLAGVGTVRLETDGCPDVKGPIPRSVLMSGFTLRVRGPPVKRKNLPH